MKCKRCGSMAFEGEYINPFRKSYRCIKCGKEYH